MLNSFALINQIRNVADDNGYGSIDYEFFIAQDLVSISEYILFLNSVARLEDPNRLFKEHMRNDIIKTLDGGVWKYELPEGVDPKAPMTNINIFDTKRLCNWLHNNCLFGRQDEKTTENGAYALCENLVAHSPEAMFWIPTDNEWYKAAYYDHIKDGPYQQGYWKYPNRTNSPDTNPTSNYFNIDNFSLYYQFIETEENESIIRGGSPNRSPENSKSSCRRRVSKYFSAPNIGARLCKRIQKRHYSIALYDTFGDGWKNNFVSIIEETGHEICNRLSLPHGYGPLIINFQIANSHKMFSIKYNQADNLSYENYYVIYNGFDAQSSIIYESPVYDTPKAIVEIVVNN